MYVIEKIIINKFWDSKTVNITFSQNENFLIGVNGSGKTTIIGLIAASLEVNLPKLLKILFSDLTISLAPLTREDSRVKLKISKTLGKHGQIPRVRYTIQKGVETIFDENLQDESEYPHYLFEEDFHRVGNSKLKDLIKDLCNTSMLSVHRGNREGSSSKSKSFDYIIDRKIAEFSHDFERYLSQLDREHLEETKRFQEFIFLSLITTEKEDDVVQTLNSLDVSEEQTSLKGVYSLFELNSNSYSKTFKSFINGYNEAWSKLSNDGSLNFLEAQYIIGMRRIHNVIQEWKKLQAKRNKIYSPVKTFLNLVNELFERKKLFHDDDNDLYVETQSGKIFDLIDLSSGEKQLLILLGEALLQFSQPHIFIADEPELSLHVEWQEKLVSCLKQLNPHSQMIFATHSPDIVGPFHSSVIKIENCIS